MPCRVLRSSCFAEISDTSLQEVVARNWLVGMFWRRTRAPAPRKAADPGRSGKCLLHSKRGCGNALNILLGRILGKLWLHATALRPVQVVALRDCFDRFDKDLGTASSCCVQQAIAQLHPCPCSAGQERYCRKHGARQDHCGILSWGNSTVSLSVVPTHLSNWQFAAETADCSGCSCASSMCFAMQATKSKDPRNCDGHTL